MPKHLIQVESNTEANILAIGAANNACEGQFYFATDTNKYYFGQVGGTLSISITDTGASSGISISGNGYTTPTAMIASGLVAIGEYYEVLNDGNGLNFWGLPEGAILRRKV